MPYIHFTDEQKLQAANVDLVDFLKRQGETLIPSGLEYRLSSDHSVTVRGNEWYDHAAQRGGSPISFVQNFYSLSYPEAIIRLLNGEAGTSYEPASKETSKAKKEFLLPPAASNMRRVFAYLIHTRGIDQKVLAVFVHASLIYEDASHHNAVFVGMDENSKARHAHKRSTNSEGKTFRINVEGSDPRYSFHWIGTDDQLYVFEAPIDLLSYISLNPEDWQRHSYVACCGISSLPVIQMLDILPELRKVHLCLDNDHVGHTASLRMAEQIRERGIAANCLIPQCKDWNDDLIEAAGQSLSIQAPQQMGGMT